MFFCSLPHFIDAVALQPLQRALLLARLPPPLVLSVRLALALGEDARGEQLLYGNGGWTRLLEGTRAAGLACDALMLSGPGRYGVGMSLMTWRLTQHSVIDTRRPV